MNRVATVLAAAVIAVAAALNFAEPAQAHHAGPFVLNSDNTAHNVMWRDHDYGTQVWHFMYPGQYSLRGATGIMVRPGTRIRYKSLATGAEYWTACGEWYAGHGVMWMGYPYMPVTDRSLQILDKHTYPSGAAAICTGG